MRIRFAFAGATAKMQRWRKVHKQEIIPAKAGIRNMLRTLDSGLRRNDGEAE